MSRLNNLNNLIKVTGRKRIVTAYVSVEAWNAFRRFARALGLSCSKALERAMREYILNHQADLPNVTVNIIQPAQVNLNLGQKAELFLVKAELTRILAILDGARDPQAKLEFALELAKAVQRAARVYEETRDPGLAKLLERAGERLDDERLEGR